MNFKMGSKTEQKAEAFDWLEQKLMKEGADKRMSDKGGVLNTIQLSHTNALCDDGQYHPAFLVVSGQLQLSLLKAVQAGMKEK